MSKTIYVGDKWAEPVSEMVRALHAENWENARIRLQQLSTRVSRYEQFHREELADRVEVEG